MQSLARAVLEDLTLDYAIIVHRAQGSGLRKVVIPIPRLGCWVGHWHRDTMAMKTGGTRSPASLRPCAALTFFARPNGGCRGNRPARLCQRGRLGTLGSLTHSSGARRTCLSLLQDQAAFGSNGFRTKGAKMRPAEIWTHLPISKIEDLSDAVRGAGLDATQMSSGHLTGSLIFSETDGMTCSSGLIDGRVSLFGPLSQDKITVGAVLRLDLGARHWLNEVQTGSVGVFLAGDEHDAIYAPGSMYAAITLTADKLEQEAAAENLVLEKTTLGGTGIHARLLSPSLLQRLELAFRQAHQRSGVASSEIADQMLSALIAHLACPPHQTNAGRQRSHYGKIVERARAYIHENLCEPISVDELAAAAYASRRTLFRAFEEILNETPRTYVRKLRLHRIRHDLAGDAEKACTIALIANQWGISDLGRMSGWYRELFGERPNETLSNR